MKIVADTSAFLAVVLAEAQRDWVIETTAGHELLAPAVLPYEVGNALTAMLKRRVLQAHELAAAWDAIEQIPVELRAVDLRAALEIAGHLSLYAYDAYFLECALRHGAPLLTLDHGLRHAADQLRVVVIEAKS
jgi:predicted nucleic acid-binding protein